MADNMIDPSDLAHHHTEDDAWIAVDGGVYDVTSWLADHPGGDVVLLEASGRDATQEFYDVGHSAEALKKLEQFRIGSLGAASCPMASSERVPVDPFVEAMDQHFQGDSTCFERWADAHDINAPFNPRKGITPLHLAVSVMNPEALSFLLQRGADVSLADSDGQTPLHYATSLGEAGLVEPLLQAGADACAVSKDGVAYVGRMPIYTCGGQAPLHVACDKGPAEVLAVLLSHPSAESLISSCDNNGDNPVDLAIMRDIKRPVDALEEKILARFPSARPVRPRVNSKAEMDERRLANYTQLRDRCTAREREDIAAEKLRDLQAIKEHYTPLHPDVLDGFTEEFLDAAFVAAIRDGSPEALRSVVTELHPGLYSFDIMTKDFCRKLLEELEHYEASAKWDRRLPLRRPNTMNNYGMVLNDIGYHDVMTNFVNEYMSPLAALLFSSHGGASLDSHHSFVVKYAIGEDLTLRRHVDDAEVTLNICLGREFEGAHLGFYGVKGEASFHKEHYEHTHVFGKALIHLGMHEHEAEKLESGCRYNLIVWARSSEYRGKKKL